MCFVSVKTMISIDPTRSIVSSLYRTQLISINKVCTKVSRVVLNDLQSQVELAGQASRSSRQAKLAGQADGSS